MTAMWASRRMALAPWPGLEAGGALWFPDLTVPALDLASQTAQVSCQHNRNQLSYGHPQQWHQSSQV